MNKSKKASSGRSGLSRFIGNHASEISIGSALLVICIILS